MPHPVLANSTDGSLHWVHTECALKFWGFEGYQTRQEREPGHPCCLCGEPAPIGALVGHGPDGMPCSSDRAHPAAHGRAVL